MKLHPLGLAAFLICISLNGRAQGERRSILCRQPQTISYNNSIAGIQPYRSVYAMNAAYITDRERRYPEESAKRKGGIVAVAVGGTFLVAGPILLGYGVTGYKSDKAAGESVKPGHYAEIGVGAALTAFGIGLVTRAAFAIVENNKILHMGRYAKKKNALID